MSKLENHDSDFFYWQAGSGRALSLQLTRDHVETVPRSGAADDSVDYLRTLPAIASQLEQEQWEPETLAAELKEYGAWEPEELADHDANLNRMLWIACGDIREEPDSYAADAETV